jgi:hypothetical protein
MYAELSFTEMDRQNAELLPARTVMSIVTSQPSQPTGGTSNGSSTGGPIDFSQICAKSPQNCDAFVSALFTLLFGPSK